jgi:hypothetical protein
MKRRSKWLLIGLSVLAIAFLSLPIWGMGPAAFLDSQRTIIARNVSPDGKRVAQVERLLVGNVSNIVIIVRPRWMPNWYLAGCPAASHYEETNVAVRWTTNSQIEVKSESGQRFWSSNSAPFHVGACDDLNLIWKNAAN